ncbi:ComEA family DNA-binding protein [candidate division WOR-3 bacterium]|nr:ComEA family DNA-binding protein [candidate division WOR-3 bacterium]
MGYLSKDELILLCLLLFVFTAGALGCIIRQKRNSRVEFVSRNERFLFAADAFVKRIDQISRIAVESNETVLTAELSSPESVEIQTIMKQDDQIVSPVSINFPVNINTADRAKLEALPGIGPVLAQRIIDYRNINGNFTRKQDIQNVRGIGTVKYAKIESLITL